MSDVHPDQLPECEKNEPAPADPMPGRAAGLGVLTTMCLAAEGVLYPIAEHLPMPIRVVAHGAILGGYALAGYAAAMN